MFYEKSLDVDSFFIRFYISSMASQTLENKEVSEESEASHTEGSDKGNGEGGSN